MVRYALAEHVFVCVNGEHLVLLDLKEDRYWALEAAHTSGLSAWVGGWPVATNDQPGATAPTPETQAALEVLRGRGLLTDGVPPGKDATPVRAIAPARELPADSENPGSLEVGGWWSFCIACAMAKIALATSAFERVISRVRQRKASIAGRAPSVDAERARKLVESFMRYRIFLFSSRNECLYDSLALIEFLARNDIHADWVFGVQTRPFAAHCWVQQSDTVLNDSVEHVVGYTPIMVV